MSVESKKLVRVRSRKYLNKDFNSFRADLLEYAKTYYSDRIKDFSESSLGGLFVDLAAYVGDVTSFYLDHQFAETNADSAVESKNVEKHLRAAGVIITGAAPAVVDVTFYIEVPAQYNASRYLPQEDALPIIEAGSVMLSNNGVEFELIEDVDFSEKDASGMLKATVQLGTKNSNSTPATFILSRTETCISGKRTSQTFSIGSTVVPFRQITLATENVTDVLSVVDSENNAYYEVESLVQDTVFRAVSNATTDQTLVRDTLRVVSAPYRYIKTTALDTRLTSLRFGGGSAEALDNDIMPDPSKFAIPLYGKKTFSRFTLDPTRLLDTRTLGIAPTNTSIVVDYRYGGGLSHNTSAGSIRTISDLKISFPMLPTPALANQVRASLDVNNLSQASGGEDAPSIDDLKLSVPAFRNSQSRIVSKEDLIARVYTLPSNFGRVFRAGLRADPLNPLSVRLYIVSRNEKNQLIVSPDTLKLNLRSYLNQFRLISESIDILDAKIVNFGIEFRIVVDPNSHAKSVIKNSIARLKEYFNVANWHIDQPITLSDVNNLIFSTPGVLAVTELKFKNVVGDISNRKYSDVTFDFKSNVRKGLILPPHGAIFETRYPEFDLVGSVE